MKKYNILTAILLGTLLTACNDSEKDTSDWFTFNTSVVKSQFTAIETLKLDLINSKNKNVDSVIFYINDKRIGRNESELTFDYPLINEKPGYKNLKALVYTNNKYAEANMRIEIISHIEPKLLEYKILQTYPHDSKAYTQGLEFHRDTLYEGTGNGAGGGTGLKGKSSLRKTNYKTGEIYQIVELDDMYFGEGITILNNKVYQLTWTSLVCFVYNADNLKPVKTFEYSKKIEGWGLCNDGTHLYQSDGTEKIWKIDPETFRIIDNINVYSGANKIKSINELEWVNGKIYGNVYQKDAIAIIDPENGIIEGIVNLAKLKDMVTQHPDLDVLNGIAYNPKTKTFFITGKNWDKLFEIEILE